MHAGSLEYVSVVKTSTAAGRLNAGSLKRNATVFYDVFNDGLRVLGNDEQYEERDRGCP